MTSASAVSVFRAGQSGATRAIQGNPFSEWQSTEITAAWSYPPGHLAPRRAHPVDIGFHHEPISYRIGLHQAQRASISECQCRELDPLQGYSRDLRRQRLAGYRAVRWWTLSYRIVIARETISRHHSMSRIRLSSNVEPIALSNGRIYDICSRWAGLTNPSVHRKQHVLLQAHRAQDRDPITGRMRHGHR